VFYSLKRNRVIFVKGAALKVCLCCCWHVEYCKGVVLQFRSIRKCISTML